VLRRYTEFVRGDRPWKDTLPIKTCVLVCDLEVLFDDIVAFVDAARGAGAEIDMRVLERAVHVAPVMETLDCSLDVIQRYLDGGPVGGDGDGEGGGRVLPLVTDFARVMGRCVCGLE
jgi:hypothetical protein